MGMGDPDRIPDEDIGASADSNEAHTVMTPFSGLPHLTKHQTAFWDPPVIMLGFIHCCTLSLCYLGG